MRSYLEDLGLDQHADELAIRRAYARKLKQIDQEKDPAGFQRLREAYEAALFQARHGAADQHESDEGPGVEREGLDEPEPASAGEIDRASAEAPVHPQAEQEESPDVDARAVFLQLMASIAEAPRNLAEVRALFDLAIEDPRLISVEARDLFEWFIAQLLSQGWRPGNECVLEVAIKHFNWQDDRRRLYRFGPVGAVLDHAIHEMNAFARQEEHARQLSLIRALRVPVRPSNGKLADGLPALEEIARRFPTLFPLITSEENLGRWRSWSKDVGAWRRGLGRSRARQVVKAAPPGGEKKSWGKSLLVGFLLMGALSTLSNVLKTKPSYYSAAPPPSSMAQGKSSRVTGPASPSLASNVDKDWLLPIPLASENLVALLAKEPTAATCSEVAVVAEAHPTGLGEEDPALARRFDNRIVTCAAMMLWPASSNDWVVRAAVDRQKPKLKSVR